MKPRVGSCEIGMPWSSSCSIAHRRSAISRGSPNLYDIRASGNDASPSLERPADTNAVIRGVTIHLHQANDRDISIVRDRCTSIEPQTASTPIAARHRSRPHQQLRQLPMPWHSLTKLMREETRRHSSLRRRLGHLMWQRPSSQPRRPDSLELAVDAPWSRAPTTPIAREARCYYTVWFAAKHRQDQRRFYWARARSLSRGCTHWHRIASLRSRMNGTPDRVVSTSCKWMWVCRSWIVIAMMTGSYEDLTPDA